MQCLVGYIILLYSTNQVEVLDIISSHNIDFYSYALSTSEDSKCIIRIVELHDFMCTSDYTGIVY